MSGTEPKEQWLCTPHSEPDGGPRIQTSREITHLNHRKLQLDFSTWSIFLKRGYYLFSRLAVFFFFRWNGFLNWVQFFIWMFSNEICLIDELWATFLQFFSGKGGAETRSCSGKWYLFSPVQEYFVWTFKWEQHHTPHVQSNLFLLQTVHSSTLLLQFKRRISVISQNYCAVPCKIISAINLNRPMCWPYHPFCPIRAKRQTDRERQNGRVDQKISILVAPVRQMLKNSQRERLDSRRQSERDDWRSALIDSSSSLALPWGWLTMWFISHFVTELIQ